MPSDSAAKDRHHPRRKRTFSKLRKSKEFYQELIETAQELIWQCDEEGRYTYLNPAWETVLGYAPAEMLGRLFTDFQSPEYAERDLREFQRLMCSENLLWKLTSRLTRMTAPGWYKACSSMAW